MKSLRTRTMIVLITMTMDNINSGTKTFENVWSGDDQAKKEETLLDWRH
jgi:hypothetical protein